MIDRIGRGLLTSSAIVAMASAAPAYAQTKSFDVAAQPAQTGVAVFGRQADIQIVAARKHTQGKQTNSVRGAMSVEEGLAQLLAGTGLTFRAAGGQTYMIVPLASAGAAGTSQGAAEAGRGQGLLVGSVRDHRTGSALKGARVEVVETGETTSTGALGDFRFARLPTGDVTLRISYLGFPEQTETVSVVGGLTNRADVYLGSGVTTEIVVIGQVSARAQALNQERAAENSSTIISGDLLGNFNGTTVSDSLRRAPGVSFQQNVNTGDGTNIIVRGLSPDYNQVSLNGVPLPAGGGNVGSSIGRSPNLASILSDSVSEIKISKTLLANQDSAGTGGLVDIETKSPLDRPKRYFHFSADGTKRAKGFGDDYLLSGTASFRFGASNNFGISASVQFRKQSVSSYAYSADGIYGAYLPLLPNGQPASPSTLDPRTPFPFYDGAEYRTRFVAVNANEARSRTRTISLSSEWQVSDATNLRLDYLRSDQRDDTFFTSYKIGDIFSDYQLAPVPGLGGELRYVYTNPFSTLYSSTTIDYTPDAKAKTDVVSFRGETNSGPLTLKYAGSRTTGSSYSPFTGGFGLQAFPGIPVDATTFLPEAIDPVTGRYLTYFGPRAGRGIPVPLLTQAGFDQLRNEPLPLLDTYSGSSDNRSRTQNWRGETNAKYEFGPGIFKYVEAGLEYRRSAFRSLPSTSLVYSPVYDANGFPVPLEDVGIAFNDLPFGSANTIYRFPTEASIREFIGRLDEFAQDGFLVKSESAPEALLAQQSTLEESMIGYVQGRIDIGRLEIIGGVRVDRTRVRSAFANALRIYDENFILDQATFDATRRIVDASDTLTSLLPRMLMNFRPSENVVVRAGYYSTVARPQVQQLNSEQNISYIAAPIFGPTGTQPVLDIFVGNPALKPARSHNFDVSGEWYDGKVGVIKLSLFYKRINNLLEQNQLSGFPDLGGFELPDNPVLNNLPANVLINFTQPVNSPDPATVWGLEAAFERQLTFLPGLFSGLGIYANYAYSDSKKTQTFRFFAPVFDAGGNVVDFVDTAYTRDVAFEQSPRHSGTVGLTYTKDGFDGSLFYTAQARRLLSPQRYGMDRYNEAVSSLDLRATYRFKLGGRDVRLAFEGRDLLKGKGDASSEDSIGGVGGAPKYYVAGNYLGGRKFSLGLSVTF